MNEYEIENSTSFVRENVKTQTLKNTTTSQIKYDLIGKIAEGTKLTRRTVGAILQELRADKLYIFRQNPEEFIAKVVQCINSQKSAMIVSHITYNQIVDKYTNEMFNSENILQSFDKAVRAKKAIQDYVFTDGIAKDSVENKFAKALDAAQEVCVYAKLPKGFTFQHHMATILLTGLSPFIKEWLNISSLSQKLKVG